MASPHPTFQHSYEPLSGDVGRCPVLMSGQAGHPLCTIHTLIACPWNVGRCSVRVTRPKDSMAEATITSRNQGELT